MNNCQNANHHHCRCGQMAQLISGILFALMAIGYLVCYFMDNQVLVNGVEVPAWKTWSAIVISALMSAWNFCAFGCKKCNKKCLPDSPHTPNNPHTPSHL
jgi:succinate dehydrogenase hydrophobic anchor subunit